MCSLPISAPASRLILHHSRNANLQILLLLKMDQISQIPYVRHMCGWLISAAASELILDQCRKANLQMSFFYLILCSYDIIHVKILICWKEINNPQVQLQQMCSCHIRSNHAMGSLNVTFCVFSLQSLNVIPEHHLETDTVDRVGKYFQVLGVFTTQSIPSVHGFLRPAMKMWVHTFWLTGIHYATACSQCASATRVSSP